MLKVMGPAFLFFHFSAIDHCHIFFRMMQIWPYIQKKCMKLQHWFSFMIGTYTKCVGSNFLIFLYSRHVTFLEKVCIFNCSAKKICTLFVSHVHFYESDQYSCKKNQSPLCPSSSAIRLTRFFHIFLYFSLFLTKEKS